jgi:hypothetical protein
MESFNYAQQGVGKRVMVGKMDFLIRDVRFWDSCAFIREFTQRHINRAIASMGTKTSPEAGRKRILPHELVAATTDRAAVCDQLLNMVFAGRDTPAVALTSIFFCIARNSNTWRKIRDEIEGMKDEDLTLNRLKSLRYVQNVIKEGKKFSTQILNTSKLFLLILWSNATLPSSCEYITIMQRGCHLTYWRRH